MESNSVTRAVTGVRAAPFRSFLAIARMKLAGGAGPIESFHEAG